MKMPQFRREGVPVAGLLLCALLWFTGIETLFPHYFLWNDNATLFLPSALFNFETLRSEHTLPVINFFQMAGWNHIGAGQTGVLYPPAYLAAWIATSILQSPLLTIDVLSIMHMTAGMLGMYVWLRLLGAHRAFAMGGAIFYLTLPFSTILSAAWIVVAYTHCFVPICFALLESNLQKVTTGKSMGYVVAKTLYMLQGYPQYVVYFSLFELLYIALRGKTLRSWKTWVNYALSNALVVVLSLPVLLPMVEATLLSENRTVPFTLAQSIDKYLNLSNVFFNQIVPYLQNDFGATNLYLVGGSIFLPWISYKVCKAQARVPRIVTILAILCIIALLLSTPLYVIISWLPVINRFRWPFKLFFFFAFFSGAACILLLQWMREQRLLPVKHFIFIGVVALLSHIAVVPSAIGTKQPFTNIHSPLMTYAHSNFRIIGVSTPHIKMQPSLYEDLPSFNYPSIWRIPALTGYDTLASRLHSDINTRLTDLSGIFDPSALPSIMDHLSRWSVATIVSREVLPAEIVEQTHIRAIASGSSFTIYENPNAFPVAAFEETPMVPVAVEYHANRIRLETANATGSLFLRVAPIAGYFVIRADGTQEPVIRTESGVLLVIQTPQEFVDIVYRSASFERGVIGALSGILFIGLGFLLAGVFSPCSSTARRGTAIYRK